MRAQAAAAPCSCVQGVVAAAFSSMQHLPPAALLPLPQLLPQEALHLTQVIRAVLGLRLVQQLQLRWPLSHLLMHLQAYGHIGHCFRVFSRDPATRVLVKTLHPGFW